MKNMHAISFRLGALALLVVGFGLYYGTQAVIAEGSCGTWSSTTQSAFSIDTGTIGNQCYGCGSNEVQGPSIGISDPNNQSYTVSVNVTYCSGPCNFNGSYYTNEVAASYTSGSTYNNAVTIGSIAPAGGGYNYIQYDIYINANDKIGSSSQSC